MSKSIKPKDNIYIDSTGIVHNRELLSNVLNNIRPVVLYNSSTGTSGNVTLSDNKSNYKSLKLLIYNTDWQEYFTFDVLTDKNNVALSGTFVADTSYDVFSILLTLSGTSITRRKTQFYNGSQVFAYNPFKIIKVLGYK